MHDMRVAEHEVICYACHNFALSKRIIAKSIFLSLSIHKSKLGNKFNTRLVIHDYSFVFDYNI